MSATLLAVNLHLVCDIAVVSLHDMPNHVGPVVTLGLCGLDRETFSMGHAAGAELIVKFDPLHA